MRVEVLIAVSINTAVFLDKMPYIHCLHLLDRGVSHEGKSNMDAGMGEGCNEQTTKVSHQRNNSSVMAVAKGEKECG